MPTDSEILDEAARLLGTRTRIALCTVIEKKGSGPRDAGAKMVVCEDGKTYGTIGGGNFERALIDECIKAIRERKSKTVTFNLSKEPKEGTVATGMVCGGESTVFVDVMESTPRLVIAGTGYVAQPLAKLASIAGFEVVIVEDERGAAGKEQFPTAGKIVAGEFARVFGELELSSNDFVVIAHGEQEHDYAALRKAVEKNPAYVGLLGSRTKASILIQRLREEGVGEAQLRTLHAPLGLEIGAQTPEEIGISILAEIIQCRRQH